MLKFVRSLNYLIVLGLPLNRFKLTRTSYFSYSATINISHRVKRIDKRAQTSSYLHIRIKLCEWLWELVRTALKNNIEINISGSSRSSSPLFKQRKGTNAVQKKAVHILMLLVVFDDYSNLVGVFLTIFCLIITVIFESALKTMHLAF